MFITLSKFYKLENSFQFNLKSKVKLRVYIQTEPNFQVLSLTRLRVYICRRLNGLLGHFKKQIENTLKIR